MLLRHTSTLPYTISGSSEVSYLLAAEDNTADEDGSDNG